MSKYTERLYSQFQKEKVSFQRWLIAALLISLFYALVFQPYLTLLTSLADLEIKVIATEKQIKTTRIELETATQAIDRANRFMGDPSEYQVLYEDSISWINNIDEIEQLYDMQSRLVSRLHDSLDPALQSKWQIGEQPGSKIIRLLNDLRPNLMENYHIKNNCFFRIETDWVACKVAEKYKPINDKLFRVLYDRSLSHQYTSKLEKEIEANKKIYIAGLTSATADANLKQWVTEYLDEEQTVIRNWYKYIARERLKLQKKSNSHQQTIDKHLLEKIYLEQRRAEFNHKSEINTPIGPIKLAFHDLLSFLPFMGLCVLSFLIRSTNRQLDLRSTIQRNGTPEETTKEALKLTLPIWIEPFNSRIKNVILLIGLALLAIISFLGLWQVMNNPGLKVASVETNSLYVIILMASVGVFFVLHYFQLVKKMRQHS